MRDNPYSQFVSLSKILLPLAALALLSTLFLFARGKGGDPAIPFATLEDIARDSRISDPRFAGVAADGSAVTISAEVMRPDAARPDAFFVSAIALRIDAPDGTHIEATAGEGEIDGRAQRARLGGLARLSTSSGYVMETGGLLADLASGTLTSIGPLEIRAPFGSLTAAGMVYSGGSDGDGQQMVFKGGVRLLYQPQSSERPSP
ncbi:MAG: hypothetical protein GW886_08770 [Rhodobacterales bacterium]|nr:hypothetical protein [Rhodobacterales bacterium]NCT13113.1 hypothetical protein [Rhodobacterales bacterium]